MYRRDANSELSVGLKDVLEEAASIVVILRLWRVFKIVEEFSAGASDRQYSSNLSNPDLYTSLSPRDVPRKESFCCSISTASCPGGVADSQIRAEMEVLGERIEKLEAENQELKRELKAWKDGDHGQ